MRIAVVGAGGVGGYFGGRLAQAGEAVTFIARGPHLQALRSGGLRVDSVRGDFVVQPADVTDDPRAVGVVDAVLVAVKAWQVPDVAESIRPLVGPATCVVPLQNGVEAPDQLAAVLGPASVAGGLCGLVSYVVAPGHIRHASVDPFVKFGELDNRPSPRLERLREAFARAAVPAEVVPDIQAALWMKFLFITPCSGVGALTRSPAGAWRRFPETRRLLEQAIDEVLAVARALAIAMPPEARAATLARIDRLEPAATVSMQRDIIAGRPSELEAQLGAVVRLGKAAGVETPLYSYMYGCLLPLEAAARASIQAT